MAALRARYAASSPAFSVSLPDVSAVGLSATTSRPPPASSPTPPPGPLLPSPAKTEAAVTCKLDAFSGGREGQIWYILVLQNLYGL